MTLVLGKPSKKASRERPACAGPGKTPILRSVFATRPNPRVRRTQLLTKPGKHPFCVQFARPFEKPTSPEGNGPHFYRPILRTTSFNLRTGNHTSGGAANHERVFTQKLGRHRNPRAGEDLFPKIRHYSCLFGAKSKGFLDRASFFALVRSTFGITRPPPVVPMSTPRIPDRLFTGPPCRELGYPPRKRVVLLSLACSHRVDGYEKTVPAPSHPSGRLF